MGRVAVVYTEQQIRVCAHESELRSIAVVLNKYKVVPYAGVPMLEGERRSEQDFSVQWCDDCGMWELHLGREGRPDHEQYTKRELVDHLHMLERMEALARRQPKTA